MHNYELPRKLILFCVVCEGHHDSFPTLCPQYSSSLNFSHVITHIYYIIFFFLLMLFPKLEIFSLTFHLHKSNSSFYAQLNGSVCGLFPTIISVWELGHWSLIVWVQILHLPLSMIFEQVTLSGSQFCCE